MFYPGHETSRAMQEMVQEKWGEQEGGAILATGHYTTLPFNTSPTRGLRQPFSQLLFPEEVSPPPLH